MEKPIQTEQSLQAEIQALQARIAALEQAQARDPGLQEETQQAEEFQRVVSHELRNPLTSMGGNIQLARRQINILLSSDHVPEEILQMLELVQTLLGRAENQVRIQNKLIEDFLDSMRIQSGQLELHRERHDLLQIVRGVIEEQQSAHPQRTILLDNATKTEPIFVQADTMRISQGLTNFMINALKYSPVDSPIYVGIEQEGPLVRVTVKDEGQGLPLDIQDRIWQRFYRAPTIKVLNGSGTRLGLGLYISRAVFEQHGGHVGVTSEPGKGATFWFTLPIEA